MISKLELDKRNLESSLLFMQQEHSTTLKALHEEINKLQKKCTELTFQLTMNGIGGAEKSTSVSEYQQRIEELQLAIKEKNIKYMKLEKENEEKKTAFAELELQLKAAHKTYSEELKQKSRQLQTFKIESENKSATIASLTAEIHKIKVAKLNASKLPEQHDSPSSSAKSRNSAKSKSQSHGETNLSSRPISTSKTRTALPEAEVFLSRTLPAEQKSDVSLKPIPPVLPPITTAENSNSFNRRQQLIKRRLEKPQPEYATLAVEPISSNSNTFINEPNTTE